MIPMPVDNALRFARRTGRVHDFNDVVGCHRDGLHTRDRWQSESVSRNRLSMTSLGCDSA